MPTISSDANTTGSMSQLYNGLDCCITHEVLGQLQQIHGTGANSFADIIYAFERALQAPALEMMLRGVKIDGYARQRRIKELLIEVEQLQLQLHEMAYTIWSKSLNPRSPKQLQEFFYGALKLPEIWTSKKGVRKLSMDREALEKLEDYFYAKPFIAHIKAIRDRQKLLEVLETKIDPDNRYRTSFNIAGTETGRWSSSKSSGALSDGDYTGGNQQNWKSLLRDAVIADPGYKLVGIDLEQAESRELGWLCGTLFDEWTYYDACLAGDLHTTTCKLVWPKLNWTGEAKADRTIAEQKFYRDFTYRDMSKRGGHGSNYMGQPFTIAKHLKVRQHVIQAFQAAYFHAYPGIPRYHRWVSQELTTSQKLTTVFGRTRHFFGRPNDDTTLREAIAYSPQSSTADRMNLILWRMWKHMGHKIQLLMQVHDAVYFQFPEELNEAEVISEALSHFSIPMAHPSGRILLVPGEAKSGWNWGEYSAANPMGLKKFRGSDDRKRHSALDRIL